MSDEFHSHDLVLPDGLFMMPYRSIVERCEDGSMGMTEWLFWCKIPIAYTFWAVTIIIYIILFTMTYITAKMLNDLMDAAKEALK